MRCSLVTVAAKVAATYSEALRAKNKPEGLRFV